MCQPGSLDAVVMLLCVSAHPMVLLTTLAQACITAHKH